LKKFSSQDQKVFHKEKESTVFGRQSLRRVGDVSALNLLAACREHNYHRPTTYRHKFSREMFEEKPTENHEKNIRYRQTADKFVSPLFERGRVFFG